MKLFVLEHPPDMDAALSGALLDQISDSDRQRYRSIPLRQRQSQFLLGRALLSHVLDREPMVTTAHRPGVSISHHGNYVCVALNPFGCVGIDVHTCRAYPQPVVRRFFTPPERRWLGSTPKAGRAKAFGGLWAVKEAICKARGTGLRFPLPVIDVPPRDHGHWEELRWATLPLDPGTAAAVAWEEEGTAGARLSRRGVVNVGLADLLASA